MAVSRNALLLWRVIILPGGRNGWPSQKRAAATKALKQDGFVAAVPSRAFRDGTGIFNIQGTLSQLDRPHPLL